MAARFQFLLLKDHQDENGSSLYSTQTPGRLTSTLGRGNPQIGHFIDPCRTTSGYEQIVSIRFKSLSYLANECGEDVTLYC